MVVTSQFPIQTTKTFYSFFVVCLCPTTSGVQKGSNGATAPGIPR